MTHEKPALTTRLLQPRNDITPPLGVAVLDLARRGTTAAVIAEMLGVSVEQVAEELLAYVRAEQEEDV